MGDLADALMDGRPIIRLDVHRRRIIIVEPTGRALRLWEWHAHVTTDATPTGQPSLISLLISDSWDEVLTAGLEVMRVAYQDLADIAAEEFGRELG
jgi:hypothetical protein